jgi:hypothetical protein
MKNLYYLFLSLVILAISSCQNEDNSKPVQGDVTSIINLCIIDKSGKDLLANKLSVTKNGLINSGFTLNTTYLDKESKTDSLPICGIPERLGLVTNLGTRSVLKENDKGTLTYKLQLPSVFGSNHTDVITLYWTLVKTNKYLDYIEPVYDKILINGNEVQLTDNRELNKLDYIVE